MTLRSRLRSLFSGEKAEKKGAPQGRDREAFLVFANTGEVIQAQNMLQAGGLSARVMAPPPALRTGCDMVLVIPLMHGFRAIALLEAGLLPPLQMTPVGETLLEPVSLFQTKDYGNWIMVRAANMKLTVEKSTGRIVNVSGGGCPDVPYLAARLIGKNIGEASLAKEHGQTLCGYALFLASEELRRLRSGARGAADA